MVNRLLTSYWTRLVAIFIGHPVPSLWWVPYPRLKIHRGKHGGIFNPSLHHYLLAMFSKVARSTLLADRPKMADVAGESVKDLKVWIRWGSIWPGRGTCGIPQRGSLGPQKVQEKASYVDRHLVLAAEVAANLLIMG